MSSRGPEDPGELPKSGSPGGTGTSELAFIRRVLVSTTWFSAVAGVVLWAYVGPRFAFGFWIGAAWSLVNFWLLKEVVVRTITLEERNLPRIALGALVKFPVLYGLGIALLVWGYFPILSLAIGFSMILVVLLLKALGRRITGRGAPGRAP